jgi:SecD/SecF fusion protein
MQNKGLIIVLTVVITALCLYYLSFTYVARGVQQDAIEHATNSDGVVDLSKKQVYLDSVWNIPVYNLFGAEYTYKEVKDNELSLGLDLQGGMHVTLEVSPVDIIKGLSANSQDSSFLKALAIARTQQLRSQGNFSDLFFEAYREANPGKRLTSLFANSATKGRIASNDDDSKVIDVVNEEIENAIDRSLQYFAIVSINLEHPNPIFSVCRERAEFKLKFPEQTTLNVSANFCRVLQNLNFGMSLNRARLIHLFSQSMIYL